MDMFENRKISILFVKSGDSEDIQDDDYQFYMSRLIASIVRQNAEILSLSRESGRKKTTNKIIFIHNMRTANKDKAMKEWGDHVKNTFHMAVNKAIIESFVKDYPDIKSNSIDSHSLVGSEYMRNTPIHIDFIESAGTRIVNWKEKLRPLFDFKLDYCLINNIGEEDISDMQSVFQFDPSEGVRKLFFKETKLNCNIFTINTYHDCEEIFRAMSNGGHDLQHLLIVRNKHDDCYSAVISKKLAHYSYKNGFKSLSIISNEDTGAANILPNGHYFFEENLYRIKKNKTNSALAIDRVFLNSIDHWVRLYCYPPSCYFAYGEKDGFDEHMQKINCLVSRFFPFLSVKRDKEDENIFMNIDKYSDSLFHGDIVIHLIGENYLQSFYAMRELNNTLANKGLISEDQDEYINDEGFKNLASYGVLPLMTKEARNIIMSNDGRLEKSWDNLIKDNESSSEYLSKEIHEIRRALPKIKKLLNKVYVYKTLDEFANDNYRLLLLAMRKAISTGSSQIPYQDIYRHCDSNTLFPNTSNICK